MNKTLRHAVILAAGRGLRMGAETESIPKALVDLGGQSLIQFQIASLRRAGIDTITVVTGFRDDELRRHLSGETVGYVHNADYATTNSLYSLCLARETLRQGALALNADVLFHFSLLQRLLEDPSANAILVDFDSDLGEEEMKVRVENGVVAAISKAIPPEMGMGENVGIIKLGARHAPAFLARAEQLFAEGQRKAWAPHCIHALVGEVPFRVIPVNGAPWTEVDFPEDLVRARRDVYPLCRLDG